MLRYVLKTVSTLSINEGKTDPADICSDSGKETPESCEDFIQS